MAMALLEFKTFGIPEVFFDGKALRFPSKKGLALLILLALEGEIGRDRLADLLWTNSENPRDALRNCLAQVNKVLTNAGALPLEANRARVVLSQQTRVDVLELELCLQDNHFKALEEIAANTQGVWLEGFTLENASAFEDWVAGRAAIHTQQLDTVLERAAGHLAGVNRFAQAIGFASKRLRLDALNEAAYRSLMRLQRAAGRETEARATLKLCISTLQRELGASPSEATLEVFDEVLNVTPAVAVESGALVGRQSEKTWLTQLLQHKGFGLLSGEAGSGKTALLRETLPENTFWLECRANDVSLPFASLLRGIRKRLRHVEVLPDWARLELSRLMPELSNEPSLETVDRLRLYAAISWLFPNNLALLIDDLHFMDLESLNWLFHASQSRLDDAQAFTILSYRALEVGTHSQTQLKQLTRLGAKSLGLSGLLEADVVALLRQAGLDTALCQDVLALTSGNALFVTETLRAQSSHQRFGTGLMPLLQQRLQTLAAPELQLAQFVAVADTEASLSLAANALNTDQFSIAQTWAKLETLRVLNGTRFGHDLLRDALLAMTANTVQLAFRLKLLEALESNFRRGEAVAVASLAQLSAQVKDPNREARYRLQTGSKAYMLGALETATQNLERCIQLLHDNKADLNQTELNSLYFELCGVYRAQVYTAPNMVQTLTQLVNIARDKHDLGFEATALAYSADYDYAKHGNASNARTAFARALTLARASQNDMALGMVLQLLAWLENSDWQVGQALTYAKETLQIGERTHNKLLEYHALEATYMFEQNQGLWQDAMQHAERASMVASEVGHGRIGRPYGLTMSAFCALQLGQLEKAHQDAQLALELLQGSTWHNGIGFAKRTFALVLLEKFELEEAREFANQSVTHNRLIDNHFSVCSSLTACARIELAANQAQTALTHLEAAENALQPLLGKRFGALMQAFIENLRGQVLHELGRSGFTSTQNAVKLRLEHCTHAEASSWLLLSPRETELNNLWRSGQTELARQELNAFLTLHPNNPRVQILHLRARAALNALNGGQPLAEQQLKSSLDLSLELGFVLQAKIATRQLEALRTVLV